MIFVRELKKRLFDETFFWDQIFWTQIFDFSQSLLYNPEGFFFKSTLSILIFSFFHT